MDPRSIFYLDRTETRETLTYRGMIIKPANAGRFKLVVASDLDGTRILPDHGEYALGEYTHQWGYGGDGPHYTAYCILFDLFGRDIPGLRRTSGPHVYKDIAITTFVDAFLTDRENDAGFEIPSQEILALYSREAPTAQEKKQGWPHMGSGHRRLLEAMLDTETKWSREQIAEQVGLAPGSVNRYLSELYDYFDVVPARLLLVAARRREVQP